MPVQALTSAEPRDGGRMSKRDDQAPCTLIITWGEPETGIWCPTCLLPSALRWPLYLLGEDGIGSEPGTLTTCDVCGLL